MPIDPHPQKVLSALIALLLGLLASPVWSHEVEEWLKAYDEAFLASFEVVLEAEYPLTGFDPSQGKVRSQVSISSEGGTVWMHLVHVEVPESQFRSRATPQVTYSSKEPVPDSSAYNFSYENELFVTLGPDVRKSRIDHAHVSVLQGGAVQRSPSPSAVIQVQDGEGFDPLNRVYRFLLPTGRGYTRFLEKVTAVEEGEEGLIRVQGRGRMFSPLEGSWDLEVDTNRNFLVRNATFLHDGSDSPMVLSADLESGVTEGDVGLWKAASFDFAPEYLINVQVLDSQIEDSSGFREEVQFALETLPRGGKIFDYTRVREDGSPTVVRGLSLP